MPLPRKIRELLLAALLLGLPLAFWQANVKAPHETNVVDRFFLRVSAPLQSAITWATDGVYRGWRRYIYLVAVEEENEQLRTEKNRLLHQLRMTKRKVRKVQRYEKLLAFRSARGIQTVGARVVARPTSPFVRGLRMRIDRGRELLRAGLPVLTADGLVGRTGRVFGDYADVILAVDPKSAVDVVVRRTGARGVLRGVAGTDRLHCRIDYLSRDEEVKVGDLVVTSGAAGVFPRDLPVARIARIAASAASLHKRVEATPAVEFSDVDEVLIVLAPPPPKVGQINEPVRRARGLTP
jgi:rod shape-determining protein MreC